MKKPTHFIEVWKSDNVVLMNKSPLAITDLGFALSATVRLGQETIAIFKLYPPKKK